MDTTWSALVIDDDPGVRQSLRLCLEADNARVLGVATSTGAIEALERSRFDVIFLDLWLQSESGLNLLPELLRRQAGIGVIVITAFASFETAVEAMRLGAADYLPKPFTPEQVRQAARRVVSANLLRSQISELQERLDETEGEAISRPAARVTLRSCRRPPAPPLPTRWSCCAERAGSARPCWRGGFANAANARAARS